MNARAAVLAGAMSEADLQAAVIDLAHRYGWLVFHPSTAATVRRGQVVHRTPQVGDAGWPDLALVHPGSGRFVVAELKSVKGRLSPEQQAWRDGFLAAAVEWHLWTPVSWLSGDVRSVLDPATGTAA